MLLTDPVSDRQKRALVYTLMLPVFTALWYSVNQEPAYGCINVDTGLAGLAYFQLFSLFS